MPKNISLQNSFIGGLKTEFTGLNFPENACTDTSNCVFTLIGDVTTRLGIDFEDNYNLKSIPTANSAISSFRWINAGGDGETEVVVVQVGQILYFFQSTNSTVANPLSATQLAGTINFGVYQATGNTNTLSSVECQYASGNGYLFVFHPDCDPFYCAFNSGSVISNAITLQIRDFLGYYPEPGNPAINFRPLTLTNEHNYNLQNQGWTGAPAWTATSTSSNLSNNGTDGGSVFANTGSQTFTVASGISGITATEAVSLSWSVHVVYSAAGGGGDYNTLATGTATAVVTSYSSTSLVLDVTSTSTWSVGPGGQGIVAMSAPTFTISPGLVNDTINTFFSDEGIYPANSDIWYTFKDDTGTFDPTSTYASVPLTTTPAPSGHFILDAFNQNQSGISNISGLTSLATSARPSTGTWFQGRVWYAGVNGYQAPVSSGDMGYYTWSESIYFSQIIQANDTTSFGDCYQINDPTDENLFDELPTDGGVITIQGCGNIYKLFPIQNGMLIFAANGVWFITGSQGIGFSATDYTITKISSVQSISSTSFVEVMGLPMFWNEEGIYRVVPAQSQGIGLAVEPLTVGTILSFYNNIPLDSKVYVRGDYNPITYVVQWVYRSTQESGIANRYQYDSILNLNVYNRAFYPYAVSSSLGTPYINGIFYINYPNSLTAPDPILKYIVSYGSDLTFAEERDNTNYVDWHSYNSAGIDYISYFVTGYNLNGKAIMKHQPIYVHMFSRNADPFAYTIQGIWDYAINPNSGRYTTYQTVINGLGQPNFGMVYRRHKIRGHGMSLQIKVSSVPGYPFDIMGWTILENIDGGV